MGREFVAHAIDVLLDDLVTGGSAGNQSRAQVMIAKLDVAIAAVLKSDAVKQRLATQGAEVFYKDAKDYSAFLQSEAARMNALIDAAGMRGAQ